MIALSARIYAGLLKLYPEPFRREYGDHMLQVFRDCCRDASDSQRALAALGFATLTDLIVTAAAERYAQMTTRQWLFTALRTAGGLAAFVASGALLGYVALMITVLFLIPWDTGFPPEGTFAAAVDAFFNDNVLLPAVIVIGCVVIAFARCLLSEHEQIRALAWRFTILNLLAVLVSGSIALAGLWVARQGMPENVSVTDHQRFGTILVYWGLVVLGGLIAFYARQAWNAPYIIRIRPPRSRPQEQTGAIS
ncbi:MAG: hypothetical protein IT319_06825 [Anaerolineae bacterium]|nr:hypothetical protein [Anaerolineae bacterium]